jgi:hypothetical protein
MTGHLREQIIIYNHAKRLGDISADKLQSTIDDFNLFCRKGGRMRQTTRNERTMSGQRTGWVSIDSATEAVIKQDWMEERGISLPPETRKVVDVNRKGQPIIMHGKRVMMTFEWRAPRSKPNSKPRWILKSWKYAS